MVTTSHRWYFWAEQYVLIGTKHSYQEQSNSVKAVLCSSVYSIFLLLRFSYPLYNPTPISFLVLLLILLLRPEAPSISCLPIGFAALPLRRTSSSRIISGVTRWAFFSSSSFSWFSINSSSIPVFFISGWFENIKIRNDRHLNEWMNEWMNKWRNEWMNEWMNI